ncbi:DDE-type integrase/transposase/recombinase [Mesoplasma tabanidae]|uniref:DDE-type integrase/transposase/recombinase n=1 Tax=Mesoplasma tabanidae TaxID=219745 RepID=UPI000C2812F8|nr:DDE-type integrase/transposase/recombinase [Mesoplasma tabanidae]
MSYRCSYIPCNKGYVYLSVLKDVASGFIVGHTVSKINDNKIYKDTWKSAEKFHDSSKVKIIHSDNGYQYTSI